MSASKIKTVKDVSDSIIARTKLFKLIVDVAQKYFNEMSRYILGMNPAEHKILVADFETAGKIIERLMKGYNKESIEIEDLYAIYEDLSTVESLMNDFILLCNNSAYAKASLAEMSSGLHSNMRADINRANNLRAKYIVASRDDDDITSFAIVINKPNINNYHNFLITNHSPNKITFELIRRLLPIATGDMKIFIEELIQEQKQDILMSSRADVGTHVRSSPLRGHECVIYRYNLIPYSPSLPLGELFKLIGWRWEVGLTVYEHFANAARYGPSIVLIERTDGTPIEFDYRGVLDRTFAATLPVKPMSGLSKNFLARYNTAFLLTGEGTVPTGEPTGEPTVPSGETTNVLSSEDSPESMQSGVPNDKNSPESALTDTSQEKTGSKEFVRTRSDAYHIKPITCERRKAAISLYSPVTDTRYPVGFVTARVHWNVVETIDGKNYRLMSSLIDGAVETNIYGSHILGLIMGTSTLPIEYNLAHSANIARTRGDMFDPVAPSHISRYKSYEKSVPASEPIKNKVVEDLRVYAQSKVSRINSNRDWQNMFTADSFITSVNEAISTTLLKNSLVAGIKSPEYTITQISRIYSIVQKFIKSITRALSGEYIPDRTFSEYVRSDIDSLLTQRFVAVVKKAADLMDSDKIWTGHDLTLKEFLIAY